MDQRDASIVRL